METINVQIPSKKEFNLVDYVPEYPGIIIAIRNGDPIGIIIFDNDNDMVLMECNRRDDFPIAYYHSIIDIIDDNEITELKLIEFK